MDLDLEDFDVAQAIDNAAVLVRERATRKGLTLDTRLDRELGSLRGDQGKVKQVLLNLLSNAVKFTPEGGRIEVRAQRLYGQVEVSVTDTGIGIAAGETMAGELIVLVEDNDKNRKLARDVLVHEGYRVVEAESGEDGVRLTQEQRPALVLMDIQLPGIDGIEALRRLRADPTTRAIPVVAVTASAMTTDRATIMAAGFDGYQPKPISVRPFLAAVREK